MRHPPRLAGIPTGGNFPRQLPLDSTTVTGKIMGRFILLYLLAFGLVACLIQNPPEMVGPLLQPHTAYASAAAGYPAPLLAGVSYQAQ